MRTSLNKILHIISSLNVGGAEMMLYRLIRESTKHPNDQHIVISLLPKGELKEQYRSLGIDVFMLDIKKNPLSSCKDIINILRSVNPNTIQTWMYHADLIGGVIARLLGFKNIFWGIRNTHPPKGNKSTYVLMKLLAIFSHIIPKKIICVADSAKESHLSEGYSFNKMTTIPNGYDFNSLIPDPTYNVRKDLNIDDNTIIIGCLGRYHNDKGQDLFIDAIKHLPHNEYKFMLVGRGCNWENEELVSYINNFKLKNSFILAGERLDIANYLSAFDIFCMPSRTEGFPNSLAEAMAMELPCVGFNVGDARKLSGEGVELVNPNDVEGLSSEIQRLAQLSKEKRKKLGKKSSDRVKGKFAIEQIYKEYISTYKK